MTQDIAAIAAGLSLDEINGLAKEIGVAPLCIVDGERFGEEWCRRLAQIVERHGAWRHGSRYPERIMGWCHSITVAAPGHMRLELRRIRDEIGAIDCDDGWATDRAGAAVEMICLAMQPETRWLANAAKHVWAFAVGTGNHNEVVKFSQDAWLREQFSQVLIKELDNAS